ncbi:hypothetical protein T492DRAFT_845431 [Pavlovales sp. CCMP2436]|nr:hypothetical protein T492DRAFT_845431 [Pavlovales sp. CCMP2436]
MGVCGSRESMEGAVHSRVGPSQNEVDRANVFGDSPAMEEIRQRLARLEADSPLGLKVDSTMLSTEPSDASLPTMLSVDSSDPSFPLSEPTDEESIIAAPAAALPAGDQQTADSPLSLKVDSTMLATEPSGPGFPLSKPTDEESTIAALAAALPASDHQVVVVAEETAAAPPLGRELSDAGLPLGEPMDKESTIAAPAAALPAGNQQAVVVAEETAEVVKALIGMAAAKPQGFDVAAFFLSPFVCIPHSDAKIEGVSDAAFMSMPAPPPPRRLHLDASKTAAIDDDTAREYGWDGTEVSNETEHAATVVQKTYRGFRQRAYFKDVHDEESRQQKPEDARVFGRTRFGAICPQSLLCPSSAACPAPNVLPWVTYYMRTGQIDKAAELGYEPPQAPIISAYGSTVLGLKLPELKSATLQV